MITNKERIEKLIEQIKRLETITEEIRERDIYPVSFFSLAFDLTNNIKEDLQQIEVYQIELFETQRKEHQAHILSAARQSVNTVIQENVEPVANNKKPAQQEPEKVLTPVHSQMPDESIEPTVKQPPLLFSPKEMVVQANVPPPVNPIQEIVNPVKVSSPIFPLQEEKKVIPASSTGRKNLIDLKKIITLNDRFLFCRELFANNENLMNQTINKLNMEESYEAAIDYLQKSFDWNFEDKHVADFTAVLKKRFS